MSWGGMSFKSTKDKKVKRVRQGYIPAVNPFKKARKVKEEKKKKAQEEAAKAYEEFVESFSSVPSRGVGTSFVRGGFIDPEAGVSTGHSGDNKNYQPKPMWKPPAMTRENKVEELTLEPTGIHRATKKRKRGHGKSRNIDSFLTELKLQNQRREDRKAGRLPRVGVLPGIGGISAVLDEALGGSFDDGDPLTTNLYVGNLPPNVTELTLLTEFGKFGPIGSVKIMWPRTEEERVRQRNCGFVSFMKREDAADALDALRDSDIFGQSLRIGWGKKVPIPPYPLPLPKAIQDQHKPDSAFQVPSGAPTLKVKVPDSKEVCKVIDIVAKYVAEDGFSLEQNIAEHKRDSIHFKFLFETESVAHLYYRWRLYSLAQGDSLIKWQTTPFQIMVGGPYWLPPAVPKTSDDRKREREKNRGRHLRTNVTPMDDENRDSFEGMLRSITPEREKIKEAMGFALDNAEKAREIVEIITESLTITATPVPKKIARLFLVSDILHNSSAGVKNASAYRSQFQQTLKDVFKSLRDTYISINGRLSADKMKEKVLTVLRIWQAWSLFPVFFLDDLEELFQPKPPTKASTECKEETITTNGTKKGEPIDFSDTTKGKGGEYIDGKSIDDINGKPLDDDIDGVPLDDDIDGIPL